MIKEKKIDSSPSHDFIPPDISKEKSNEHLHK